MSTPAITRFAPSPTGFLHIGGARTALFNWLYSRKTGGKMLLRIEDTDRARSTEQAVEAIYEGLNWLGLEWDGDAISQFANVQRHQEVAQQLLDKGLAYKCYASPEELQQMREEARAAGLPPQYDGRWRDRPQSDAPEGVSPVIRIKAPQDGEIVVDDLVQGKVTFAAKDLDDFIILRSDGTPTYMMAVVVDDHDMGVTHIVRGDDHLTNAARQTVIFRAMGWPVPQMAHIPLIHGPDGAKLSKRHGALGAQDYRAMGFMRQALRNYLVRLGWSHGDDEVMSLEDMIKWFELIDINKGASRFDLKKLEALNGHYMRNNDDQSLLEELLISLPYLSGSSSVPTEPDGAQQALLLAALPSLKARAKTLVELRDGAAFMFDTRPLAFDEKAQQLIADAPEGLLADVIAVLESLDDWSLESTDAAIRALAESKELKLGKVAQPLRAALTGRSTSPGIFDVLVLLGKEESLARLAECK